MAERNASHSAHSNLQSIFSPLGCVMVFSLWCSKERTLIMCIKLEDKTSSLHPWLIDQKDMRKGRQRSNVPVRNPPTGQSPLASNITNTHLHTQTRTFSMAEWLKVSLAESWPDSNKVSFQYEVLVWKASTENRLNPAAASRTEKKANLE